MLVLSRKVGEQIQIGDRVVVTVVRISGNTVRLAVEAPQAVKVVRTELVPPLAAAPHDCAVPCAAPATPA